MAIFSKIHETLIHLFTRTLILVEAILFLRVVLKFLGANPMTFVVKILYALTSVLIWPVNSIFPNFYLGNHLVDIIAISAMIGYLIVLLIVRGILRLIFKDQII